jgi:hypothetical protein
VNATHEKYPPPVKLNAIVVVIFFEAYGSRGETGMMMVMDMSSGKIIEDEFGAFEDEVLNAEWTPPAGPELQLGLQQVQHRAATAKEVDAENFLATMYRNQQ